MKFKKPQQFIQQFASTSGSSLFAQIFSALTSLLISYGSILLLWLSYRLGKWSNFLGENTFTRDCPCVTSSLAPLVMYPFQRSKTTCAGKQRLLNHLTHLNAIQKKSKRGGSEFSFWRISPMRIFAQAKFRFYGMRNFAKMTAKFEIRGTWTNFGDELSSNVRENKRNRRISLYFCTSPYSKFVNSLCRGTEYIGLKIPTWVRFKWKQKRRERQKVKGKTRVDR